MLLHLHAQMRQRPRVREVARRRLHRSDQLRRGAARPQLMGRKLRAPRPPDQQRARKPALVRQAAPGHPAAVISPATPPRGHPAAVISPATPPRGHPAAVISLATAILGHLAAVISLATAILGHLVATSRGHLAAHTPVQAVQADTARRVQAAAQAGSVALSGARRLSRRNRRVRSPSRRKSSSKTWLNCSRRRRTT
jgi:hypothetical protein